MKYLSNVIEADHGKLNLLIGPIRGFKTMRTAYATVKGFEVMRALRKGQAGMFALQGALSARLGSSSASGAATQHQGRANEFDTRPDDVRLRSRRVRKDQGHSPGTGSAIRTHHFREGRYSI